MQHQSIVALARETQLPQFSVLLCKRVTANAPVEIWSPHRCAVMHHQSTAAMVRAKKFPIVQCCSANQAHSMLLLLQVQLWRFALHICMCVCNTKALQHWSGQHSYPIFQCCSANQAHSMFFAPAITPMEICSPLRCVCVRHQSIAALVRETQLPHFSVLLCKPGSQHAALFNANCSFHC